MKKFEPPKAQTEQKVTAEQSSSTSPLTTLLPSLLKLLPKIDLGKILGAFTQSPPAQSPPAAPPEPQPQVNAQAAPKVNVGPEPPTEESFRNLQLKHAQDHMLAHRERIREIHRNQQNDGQN